MDNSAVWSKTDILTITSTSQIIVTSAHYTVIAKVLDCEGYLVMDLLKWPWSLSLCQCVLFEKTVSYEKFHDTAFIAREIIDHCLRVRISKNLMLRAH